MNKEKAKVRTRARRLLKYHQQQACALPSGAVSPVMARLASLAAVPKRAMLVEFAAMRRRHTQRG